MLRFIILSSILLAAAPPNPDPALAPFYQGLKQPGSGGSCCNMADCCTVDYRMTDKGYEVYIDKKSFREGPDQWVPVPALNILPPQSNPTGEGVACWTQVMGVLCFVRASAT